MKIVGIAGLLNLFFMCLLACKEDVKENKNVLKPSAITLIFKGLYPISNSYKSVCGLEFESVDPKVFYWDGKDKKELIFKDSTENRNKKVVKLYPFNEFILLRHRYDAYNYNEFLLMKGDSAVVEYVNNRPLISIINRKTSLVDMNYDEAFRKRFFIESFLPWFIFTRADMFADWSSKGAKEEVKGIKRKYSRVSLKILEEEKNFLDSLKDKGLISSDYFNFFKNRNNNILSILKVKNNNLDSISVTTEIEKNSPIRKEMPVLYHQQLVESIADKYIVEQTPILDLKDGINRDYRKSYSVIRNSLLFNSKDKNMLLTREIQRIGDRFSLVDFRKYFEYYKNDVSDTILVNEIKDKYSLKLNDKSSEVERMIVVNNENKIITLEDIKRRHTGKIVYIDFWASWCAPCRAAFPQSMKLRDELKNKDIVFIYLSIDQTIKPWQVASEKEKLNTYSENYLVVNYQASDFVKQQKLSSIPRYMIFDKQGNILYPNAPRVESKELKVLLTELAGK